LGEIPSSQILYAGLAALAGPFLGRLCLMISARYVEARVTTLANLTAPAMTLVFAWLLLSDWPAPHQLIGGAIMIAGISIPLLRPRRSNARGSNRAG
jgi:drug/metabolite transporter (DMT)-like permease